MLGQGQSSTGLFCLICDLLAWLGLVHPEGGGGTGPRLDGCECLSVCVGQGGGPVYETEAWPTSFGV